MTCEIIKMPVMHILVNIARLLKLAKIHNDDAVEIIVMKNQITILNVNKKGKK